jgi:hypothetical protein
MHKITEKEFPLLSLGDVRRNQRFTTILNNIVNMPGQSILQQNDNWYDVKATYTFFSNKSISLAMLQQAIYAYGKAGVAAPLGCVLVLHDTTNLCYNGLEVEGLGYLDKGYGKGLMLHNSIVASTSGIPLALLHQQLWTRSESERGKTKDRSKKKIEDKESYKWLKGIEETNQMMPPLKKIHIADREADIYELFFMPPHSNAELLIRACRSRKTTAHTSLWDTISNLPPAASVTLQIPNETGHKKQAITAQIRYRKTELLRPKNSKSSYNSVWVTAIEVRQPTATKEKGVWWKLLTTLEVKDVEDVKQYVTWYTYRWLIERFHYVLKSGCGIEALQLKNVDALKKAIVLYSLAGFKIMQLTYQSRETPDVSCETVLDKTEWQALYLKIHQTTILPSTPPTLKQAAQWVGKLGGYLGRNSDGPPGVKVMWRGYQRLKDFTELYRLFVVNQNLGKE